MKWLLITTAERPGMAPSNPGDEFARIGIQKLIREVDPKAEFDLLNKEDPLQYVPREFDRAVICGMPLFWSTEQDNVDIWWWNKIFGGWIAQDRRKFMAMGVGHVLVDNISNFPKYVFSINYVLEKTWALTVREPILDHPKIIDSVCPSAFAVSRSVDKFKRICNFMVNTGHFNHLATPSEGESWKKKETTLVAALLNSNFEFVAHTPKERDLARSMGWPVSKIHWFSKPEHYLELYQQATHYFGHRLHGAAVVAAAGGDAWGVAYDSRIKMVQRLGGYACRPSEFSIEDFRSWLHGITVWTKTGVYDIEQERHRMVSLLRRFAHGP